VKQEVVQTSPAVQLSQQLFPQQQLRSIHSKIVTLEQQQQQQQVDTIPSSSAASAQMTVQQQQPVAAVTTIANNAPIAAITTGRRSITLRLLEEVTPSTSSFSQGGISSNQQHASSSSATIIPPPLSTKITSFRAIQRLRSLSAGSGRFFGGYTTSATAAAAATSDDTTTHQRAGSDSEIHPLKDATRQQQQQQHGETTSDSNNTSNSSNSSEDNKEEEGEKLIEHGIIKISWYDGTTSTDMVEHVHNCVLRKIQQQQSQQQGRTTMKLVDVRLLDEIVTPNSHGGESSRSVAESLSFLSHAAHTHMHFAFMSFLTFFHILSSHPLSLLLFFC
jgi:hypothetical protein